MGVWSAAVANSPFCEYELRDATTCGIAAIGRCRTCEQAFCATHQARDIARGSSAIKTYVDWCITCQGRHNDEVRDAATKADYESARRLEDATANLPALVSALTRTAAALVKPRDWTETISKGPGFFSPKLRYTYIAHDEEPAIPVGDFTWRYWFVPHPRDGGSAEWKFATVMTGLTLSGNFVPMDVQEPAWRRTGFEAAYLIPGQEAALYEALEPLLQPFA